jgi:hypothetical protein
MGSRKTKTRQTSKSQSKEKTAQNLNKIDKAEPHRKQNRAKRPRMN